MEIFPTQKPKRLRSQTLFSQKEKIKKYEKEKNVESGSADEKFQSI